MAQRCRGQEVNGESLDLELVRHTWQEVVENDKELFEDRRAAERCFTERCAL